MVTIFTFFFSQLCLLFKLLRANLPKNATIYVNTLLPFGGALFGWITRRRVVYHLHEVSVDPAPLRWVLVGFARLTADQLVYVSKFHRDALPIPCVPALTVPNALDQDFASRARCVAYAPRHEGIFRVLMLASLRDYKGVPEYLSLASRLKERPSLEFHLVMNDDEEAIKRYFGNKHVSSNVTLHARTTDPVAHYARASLVMNLSRPDQWVETFGLTLLEGMACGVPVIAPPVGGPLELVTDGVEGFLLDCRDGEQLAAKIELLAVDEALCLTMSAAARRKAARFSHDAFVSGLCEALELRHPSITDPATT
jgi:glycosyltransferase involved in cell wall biosynthesis